MKFKKMAAVALAGVTACATVPAAVPVFAVMCRLVLLQVQRHAKHSKKFRERLGRHFKS